MEGSQAVIVWIVELAVLAISLYLGYHIARSSKQTDNSILNDLNRELSELEGEFQQYREHVAERINGINNSVRHFNESYAQLYEHLKNDSEMLVEEDFEHLQQQAEAARLSHQSQ